MSLHENMKFATRKQPNNEYKTQSIHRERAHSQQVEFIVTRTSERTNDQMIMMNVMPSANINTEFIKILTNNKAQKNDATNHDSNTIQMYTLNSMRVRSFGNHCLFTGICLSFPMLLPAPYTPSNDFYITAILCQVKQICTAEHICTNEHNSRDK